MKLNLSPLDVLNLALSASRPVLPDPAQQQPSLPWYEYRRPSLGFLLRAMIRELHMTQRDLAVKLDLHYVTLNRLVQGRQARTRLSLKTRRSIESLCAGHPVLEGLCRMAEWPNL
jgi:hypothetical protein